MACFIKPTWLARGSIAFLGIRLIPAGNGRTQDVTILGVTILAVLDDLAASRSTYNQWKASMFEIRDDVPEEWMVP